MFDEQRKYGPAWVGLCLAIALHVADEAANNFLLLYNPSVLAIRQRLPWLAIPTFTFRSWITLLGIAILALLVLSPLAFRGSRRFRPFAYVAAILMILNGIQHIVGSIYLRRYAAGVYSSPVLISASIYLLIALRRTNMQNKEPAGWQSE